MTSPLNGEPHDDGLQMLTELQHRQPPAEVAARLAAAMESKWKRLELDGAATSPCCSHSPH
jgi:hypothetical protein